MDFSISPATERDLPAILRLVKALARYEKLEDHVVASEDDFRIALFGDKPVARALVAFAETKAVGFALFFRTFSTFLGKRGLYLEDIFVEPEYRGKGIGRDLLSRVAQVAIEEHCGRLEWAVLTWNQPSIDFYHRMGAVTLHDWRTFRLTGEALEKAAGIA
jgi:GNAT superfamily N-acetyltransferase